MFEHQLFFKLDTTNLQLHPDGTQAQQLLEEICDWCSTNFKANYIIIEHARQRISGGWLDNRKGWEEDRQHLRREYAHFSQYELRCDDKSLSLFFLKWT